MASEDLRTNIQGWGADLDPQNRPAYPKERTPPRLENVHWKYPQQQPVRVPVFHSIERPAITPVFGSAVPPSGVSGAIRRFAYKLSENDVRHWLILLFADRVNAIEGLVDDARRGRGAKVIAAALTIGAAAVVAWSLTRPQPRRRFSFR